MESIVIVAHKYLPQPDDELVAYLNAQRRHKVLHICHSFPDAPDRRSFFRLYERGRLEREGRTRDYRAWPDPLVYLKEMFFTLLWAVRHGPRWDRYIGMDGLCAAFGNLLRAFGFVRRTVFWAIDFVPENRFKGRIRNWIYDRVNRHGNASSDEMWDLSPRMADAREELAAIPRTTYRHHKVVPYGVWLERIRHHDFEQCEQRTAVFMGHLLEKQGAQLVIRAIPRIVAAVPDFQFKIIGGGAYREALERLARELGVDSHCRFLGKIAQLEEVEQEIARSAVAVAPYIRALDTWTAYADPGKVKTYLACGVPVLLTDVPWNARQIEQEGCGKVITEDPADIAESIVRHLDPDTNRRMRERARRYALQFDYRNIFNQALPEYFSGPVAAEAGARA
jgi:glycosyltransferase involved in cell wall biosynthesis